MSIFAIVPQSVHVRALEALAAAHEARLLMERQKTQDNVMIGWLCARVNQLEKTNAVLFHAVTNLNIPVPEVAPAPAVPVNPDLAQSALFGAAMFEDVGDEEAKRQGIGYDDSGRVKYSR